MRHPTTLIRAGLACSLALLAIAASADAFDKVLLKDGRLIEGKILDEDRDGAVQFEIRGMEITIPHSMVDKSFVEDLEDYVPKDAKEAKYLKKGWVLFEGRWMSKSRREQELEQRAKEQEEAIAESRRLQDWQSALEVETDHFIMKTNVQADIAEEFAFCIDAYYKYFTDFWSIKRGNSDKLKFFLYRNERDYLRLNGMPYGVKGHFSPVTEDLHLFYDHLDPEFSFDVLFHEGNHLITYLIDPDFMYPRWMHESMAEYFGSADMDSRGNFELGALQYGRIAAMRAGEESGRIITPKEVLLTPHQAFTAAHYAVGWSFVHFLMESPKYGKKFVGFFRTLPKNSDIPAENRPFMNGTRKFVDEPDVLAALEKRLGRSMEELEEEWRESINNNYQDMPAKGYYRAAQLALFYPQDDGSHVTKAFDFFERAVQGGIEDPTCFRRYAELLRKGGIIESRQVHKVQDPNPAHAWEMITRAIELDPVNAYSYCEAAGILIMDSEVQDIDLASQMVITARALAPNSGSVRGLYESLVDKIRDVRKSRKAAADAVGTAVWRIQPAYIETEERPEHILDLSTDDIRERIGSGEFDGNDWAFNGVPAMDPETGERPPKEKWDSEWVQLKDIPWFREALEAAGWEFAEDAGNDDSTEGDGAEEG